MTPNTHEHCVNISKLVTNYYKKVKKNEKKRTMHSATKIGNKKLQWFVFAKKKKKKRKREDIFKVHFSGTEITNKR